VLGSVCCCCCWSQVSQLRREKTGRGETVINTAHDASWADLIAGLQAKSHPNFSFCPTVYCDVCVVNL